MSEITAIAQKSSEYTFNLIKEHGIKTFPNRNLGENGHANGKDLNIETNPLFDLRLKEIKRICAIQQDLLLYVRDTGFVNRIIETIEKQVTNLYEAKNALELELVSMGVARIQNTLDLYKIENNRRKNIRVTGVLVSLAGLVVTGFLAFYLEGRRTHVPVLEIPVDVFLWSVIGSFTAIVYRFNNNGDSELSDPLRWLYSRPVTGIIMGVMAYLVIRVGLVQLNTPQDDNAVKDPAIIWLLVFLASFSDRFSNYLLKSVAGRFGSDGEDLISFDAPINTKGKTFSPDLKMSEGAKLSSPGEMGISQSMDSADCTPLTWDRMDR